MRAPHTTPKRPLPGVRKSVGALTKLKRAAREIRTSFGARARGGLCELVPGFLDGHNCRRVRLSLRRPVPATLRRREVRCRIASAPQEKTPSESRDLARLHPGAGAARVARGCDRRWACRWRWPRDAGMPKYFVRVRARRPHEARHRCRRRSLTCRASGSRPWSIKSAAMRSWPEPHACCASGVLLLSPVVPCAAGSPLRPGRQAKG